MPYAFKRKEKVEPAIRRIGAERIAHAAGCLKSDDPIASVHGARKDIKKLRALLRLSHSSIGKKQFREHKRRLREIAGCLAPARDAYVKTETLRKISSKLTSRAGQRTLARIRTYLHETLKTEIDRYQRDNTAARVRELLKREEGDIARLRVRGNGWKCLQPAISRAYGRGREAYRRLDANSTPQQFHRWRKRAKDTWYQLRLLQRMAVKPLDALTGELDTLSDQLGEIHDLFVLWQEIEGSPAMLSQKEQAMLRTLIERRTKELGASALAAGAKIYREKPIEFSRRLGKAWERWRGE